MPADKPKAEFLKYHYPKAIEDDANVFPIVVRIPDGMLKKVDPLNPVLKAYLLSINTNDGIGILLSKHDEGSSKKSRKSKTVTTPEKTDKETTVSKSSKKQLVEMVKVSKMSEKSQETAQHILPRSLFQQNLVS